MSSPESITGHIRHPEIPADIRIYAIGDVHGRVDLLDTLFARVDAHRSTFPVSRAVELLLGDYIDRGPHSREVIESVIARKEKSELIALTGNHEQLLLEALRRPEMLALWSRNGGLETLMSYGLRPSVRLTDADAIALSAALQAAMPRNHLAFFTGLRYWFHCGDYFFCHAGVRPGVPLTEQRPHDLIWIRDEFLDSDNDFGAIVVHGHTPVSKVEIHPNRINIDTGAYITGTLTCLVLQGGSISTL